MAEKQPIAALAASESIDRMLSRFGWLGDSEDVLQRAGISRAQLRALEGDDEISAALETRRDAACNTPHRFEHETDAEFFNAAFAPLLERLLESSWSAVPYGVSLTEIVFCDKRDPINTTPGRIGLAAAVDVPFELCLIKPDGWIGWRESLEEMDRRKFFPLVRNQSMRRPMGESLLARLYWPWFFRSNGWKFWVKYLERSAIPLLYGQTDSDRDAAMAALRTAAQDAVIVAGSDDKLSAINASGSGSASFERFEEAVVRRYHRTILGQTLTSGTDGGSGNRALGDVHEGIRAEKKRSDCRMLSGHIQRIANQLAALNGMTPPRFVMEDGSGLEADRAARDKTLTDAGMVKFTPDYIKDKYGLLETDFTIPEAPTANNQPAAFRFNSTPGKEDRPTFTAGQQVIEDRVAEVIASIPSPVDEKAIKGAIRAARSVADLEDRLQVLLKGRPHAEMADTLEKAVFAAQVMGFAHAESGH